MYFEPVSFSRHQKWKRQTKINEAVQYLGRNTVFLLKYIACKFTKIIYFCLDIMSILYLAINQFKDTIFRKFTHCEILKRVEYIASFLVYLYYFCLILYDFLAVAYPALKLNFAYYIPFLGFYYRPWRLLNQIIALLSLINFILIKCYIFESPKFYISKGEHDMGLGVLRKIYAVNFGKSVEDFTVSYLDEFVV